MIGFEPWYSLPPLLLLPADVAASCFLSACTFGTDLNSGVRRRLAGLWPGLEVLTHSLLQARRPERKMFLAYKAYYKADNTI